jgi:hypothetical protein
VGVALPDSRGLRQPDAAEKVCGVSAAVAVPTMRLENVIELRPYPAVRRERLRRVLRHKRHFGPSQEIQLVPRQPAYVAAGDGQDPGS